jgi:hypothetical protein
LPETGHGNNLPELIEQSLCRASVL